MLSVKEKIWACTLDFLLKKFTFQFLFLSVTTCEEWYFRDKPVRPFPRSEFWISLKFVKLVSFFNVLFFLSICLIVTINSILSLLSIMKYFYLKGEINEYDTFLEKMLVFSMQNLLKQINSYSLQAARLFLRSLDFYETYCWRNRMPCAQELLYLTFKLINILIIHMLMLGGEMDHNV